MNSKRDDTAKANSDTSDKHPEPELRVINQGLVDLKMLTSFGWKAVEETNEPPLLFRYGGIPSRLEHNDEGVPILKPLTPDRLRHELARRAVWCHGKVRAKPQVAVVRDMLATPEPPLPVLTRITEIPVFAADGTLQTQPGYYEASRTYYAPQDGFTIDEVPANPTLKEIEQAKTLILDELLGDFPFVEEGSRAHAVSLFLLPFVRSLISGPTPLHLIEAPIPGSGKGLLSDVLLGPAVGRRIAVMAQARDGDEWRKRITANLMGTPEVILIDNVTVPLDSGELSSALTAETWRDRILGKSQTIELLVRCIWVATANNPELSTEMVRRSIRIRLDPKCPQPWTLDNFKHSDLRGWAQEQRAALVWSGLLIIRAWISQSRPLLQDKLLGSFEKWAAVMGGILETIGIPGFLSNLHELYEVADVEASAWRGFVQAWWEKFGGREVGVGLLLPLAAESGLELRGTGDQGQRVSLGKELTSKRDRIIDQYRITNPRTAQGAKQWKLQKVS